MDKAKRAKHEEAKRARSEVNKRTAVLRTARISPQKARLVADQDPDAVEGQLRAYLEEHVPKDVQWTLHKHSSGPGSTMDRKSRYMKAAELALKTVFGRPPLFKREGGSVPIVGLLQKKLGVDSVMLGFALPDDGIHGPNEKQYLPNFFRGIETYIHYLMLLGNNGTGKA